MERRDGAYVRRQRLNEILSIIEKSNGILREKLVAIIMSKFGLTKARAEKYLEDLEFMEHIETKDGKVLRVHL